MTFVITQPCIDTMDQSCVEVCPVDCIHFEEGADRMLYINPAECIDCGACQPACPVNAIFPDGDVPADATQFTEINSLWYDDPAAARAQVGGSGTAAPPTAAPVAPTGATATTVTVPSDEGQQEAAPTAPDQSAQAYDTAEAAAGATPDEAPVTAEQGPPAEALPPRPRQVEAVEEHLPTAGLSPLPSAVGVIAVAIMGFAFFVMWVFPGPKVLEIAGLGIHAAPLLMIPLFLLGLLIFVRSQSAELSRFAAHHTPVGNLATWRSTPRWWRRSEESRRYAQERVVEELAATRFAFPDDRHPSYRTHVNVPEPQLALEFEDRGGVKVFPDILVVDYPGNYPVMVAQVETRETVTPEQARLVWSQFENKDAPLYIYVPSGLGGRAKQYAKAAGMKHVQFRTWRRLPTGVVVEEI